MLLGGSCAAMAQTGTKADVDAVKNLVKNKPADYDKQLKAFAKANKKSAENLVALGRALYEADDTLNARSFAEQALAASKRNCAPAYMLLGDICAKGDDGGAAALNYEQAILVDPKNPDPYRRYATVYSKISPEGAVAKLDELRQQRPDYPVDALIGHISYNVQRYATAIEAFGKVPMSQMTRWDFIEYGRALQLARKFEESQKVVAAGLAKEPLNATLNRFAMMNCNELKQFPEALKYAETLFNKVDKDSVNFSEIDYQNYGQALDGCEQFEAAIIKYKEALVLPEVDDVMKADLLKSISDSYKGMKNFPEAISTYEQFLAAKAEADATDHAGLPILIAGYARSLEGEEKTAMLQKADEAYANLVTKFADAEEYALWQRGRINAQMDPDLTGLAKGHFERLIELVTAHETLDDADKTRLFDAYSYLMRYSVKQKDSKAAYQNALKLQELQPEDAEIQKVVEALEKAAK